MNNRGNVALITLVVIALLAAGGYWYWQSQDSKSSKNAINTVLTSAPKPTVTATPTLIATPTLASTNIESPSGLSQWQNPSQHKNYNWSFKYPPTWTEEVLPLDASADNDYYPTVLADGQFTTVFTRIVPNAASVTKRIVDKGLLLSVIKRESFTIDGKSAELVVNERQTEKGKLLEFSTTIRNVDLLGIDGSGVCIGTGELIMENFFYLSTPDFTQNDIPYERDIKDMLSTFSFNTCDN